MNFVVQLLLLYTRRVGGGMYYGNSGTELDQILSECTFYCPIHSKNIFGENSLYQCCKTI